MKVTTWSFSRGCAIERQNLAMTRPWRHSNGEPLMELGGGVGHAKTHGRQSIEEDARSAIRKRLCASPPRFSIESVQHFGTNYQGVGRVVVGKRST
jgi:hypothetical protein